MAKAWRYYEGTTSANNIIKDLAKVLCTAVKTEVVKDGNGQIVKDREVIIDKNWDIVFPQPQKDQLNVMDWSTLTPAEYVAKINNQINQAGDKIILKTKTSPKDLLTTLQVDDIGLENDLNTSSIEIYFELYKPMYLADPEKYHPEVERKGIMPYCITKDIYRKYSNKVGETELNLKRISDPKVVITNPIKNTAGSREVTYTIFKGFLDSYNTAVGTAINMPDTVISEITDIFSTQEKLQRLKGTSALNTILDITGMTEEEFFKSTRVSVKLSIVYYSGNYHRVINISCDRQYEAYTIMTGFQYQLPQLEKANASSIHLYLNNQGSQTELDSSYWTYDLSTYTLKILKNISGATEQIGEPILKYQYEKDQTTIAAKKLLYNNHYIYTRVFDVINSDFSGPMENVIDDKTGDILQVKSHVSEWSKLSWYQDFEEVLVDELDGDVGENDITNGTLFLPVETPGLNGDTRIRFWINTNNDRAALVVMGNPSLDFGKNRHLISAAYFGQIESFENSINDTAGNFALFTSSSTTPCASKTVKKRVTMTDEQPIAMGNGTLTDFTMTLSDDKFFDTLGVCEIIYEDLNTKSKTTLANGSGFSVAFSADKKTANIKTFSAPGPTIQISFSYNYYIEKYEAVDGVIRDGFGNVLNIDTPDTYGKNTATGVIDIAMLHTRSKAYFQKHHLMFTTTEEYMTKELYGKSAYTNEYYADKLKVTHGNDGPRGILADCLAIDTSSLYAFDELIVNRDFKKDPVKPEETYIFFPITAPFSPFAGSPNATYGFAIKKSVRNAQPVDDNAAVDEAIVELDLLVGNLNSLTEDIVLPDVTTNGSAVTWASSDDTLITVETI